MTQALLDDLAWRGLLYQCSDTDALTAHLADGPRTLYAGFDPTADSLHIGSLVGLLFLRRFQLAGHRPVVLVGGATGLIGDPSFKADERSLNTPEVVAGWVKRLRAQVSQFVDFDSGNTSAAVVNNLDWTGDMDVITFLRDVGKHFSVNAMMQKESVRARITRDGAGISFTEFSYSILQSFDYVQLAKRFDCSLQVGGSDQWGNITAGMDLVRRMAAKPAFALTWPLVTKADGSKFGKTESGTIWLDAGKTSPYSFYQFWMNAADDDVVAWLKMFTFLAREEIGQLAAAVEQEPQKRQAQQRLASEVTSLVHGEDALKSAKRITQALFSGGISDLTEPDLAQLRQDGMACTEVTAPTVSLVNALADSGLAGSRGAARKLVQGRGIRVNGELIDDVDAELTRAAALFGRFHVIRRGKKVWHLLAWA